MTGITTTKNHGGFSPGDRVVAASKANPVLDVGTVDEFREQAGKVRVVWDRSGHRGFYHSFELSSAPKGAVAFDGTIEEWREENDRRQTNALVRFFESHVCTPLCNHSFPTTTERSAT